MPRPFADLVDELVADCRNAPAIGDLELEALGFATAFEAVVEDQAGEAAAVVERLAAHAEPHAAAALRAIALYGRGPLGDEAARAAPAGDGPPAAHVGIFEVQGVWRSRSDDVVADLVWLGRPDGTRQSFVAVTGPDGLGGPLLGGGLGSVPDGEDCDDWLGALTGALGTGLPKAVTPQAVVRRLQAGAATNDAILVEVSAPLAMGMRLAAHALAGRADAVPALPFDIEGADSDDDRAAYINRVLARAVAEGVDPADRAALLDWHAGFQRRTPNHQLQGLGVASPPTRRGGDAERRAKRKAARKARRRNR
jgi:hypothetical protein